MVANPARCGSRHGEARWDMRSEEMQWRSMASAPKDGSRVIAVIRGSEQGAADVDIIRWAQTRNSADACWISSDSTHDCAIVYEDWEVVNWMPLPSTMPAIRTPYMRSKLPDFPRDGEEIGGSGI